MSNLAPIALFVYKRVSHLRQTIKYLQQNEYAKESDLLIFSDYPKSQSDIKCVEEVRNFCSNISNFKSVNIVLRHKNFGLAKNLVSGISEVLKKNDKVIVLEDDLVTDKFFLKYINDALIKYQNNYEVISVHGYVYPLKNNQDKTFFLKGADCWGWGTWKRGWNIYNENSEYLLENIKRNNLKKEFDFNNNFNFFKMLKKTIKDKNSSWAIKWYASAFLNNKLTLYPPHSLIHNIGNDGSGTNSPKNKKYDNILKNIPIKLENIQISESRKLRHEFENYFNDQSSILKKIYNKFV